MMVSRAKLVVGCACVAYCCVSLPLLRSVHSHAPSVVDEQFHVPQGLAYCEGNFSRWDPKLTTLPGLYVLSSALLAPLSLCSLAWLRAVVWLTSLATLVLAAGLPRATTDTRATHRAFNIVLLPPLFFFAHLYYTDVPSLAMVLLMLRLSSAGRPLLTATCAAAAVLMRQTNVAWVGFLAGARLLESLWRARSPPPRRPLRSAADVVEMATEHLRGGSLRPLLSAVTRTESAMLIGVLMSFVAFVFWNGSVVVGDRSAHEAAVHFPQLLYLSAFFGVFSVPSLLSNLGADVARVRRHWKMAVSLCVVSFLAVHYNTLEHPYLLADNRHYIFYVWNRFYRRYWFGRYLCIPLYVYLTMAFCGSVGAGFLLPFLAGVIVALVPQRLLELRYFLTPFILHQLWTPLPSRTVLSLQTAYYALINALAFYVFFTKEIYWTDFEHVQRMIW